MTAVLFDDWLYMDVDGKTSVCGPEEGQRSLKSKIKNVNVAFLDYQTKVVTPVQPGGIHLQAMVSSSFDKDYIITQEKLPSGSMQVIGAKKEKIEEIYHYFKGIHVESLVPYGLALRAILKSKNFLETDCCVAFLDDLGSQAILTFFEKAHLSSPRRISMRDIGYMTSEIKRSWQNFLLEHITNKDFSQESLILISNNKQWAADFIAESFLPKEQIIHIDIEMPVLQGLKIAKFPIHFALAEEILKQKKFKIWKEQLQIIVVSIFLILIGISLYFVSNAFFKKEFHQSQYLQLQNERWQSNLKLMYQRKFLGILYDEKGIDYQKIYYDFLAALPEGYLVDNFQIQKQSHRPWRVQAVIYPQSNYTSIADFKNESLTRDVRISPIITHKVLGQRIDFQLTQEEGI